MYIDKWTWKDTLKMWIYYIVVDIITLPGYLYDKIRRKENRK